MVASNSSNTTREPAGGARAEKCFTDMRVHAQALVHVCKHVLKFRLAHTHTRTHADTNANMNTNTNISTRTHACTHLHTAVPESKQEKETALAAAYFTPITST